ncbi:MAG: alpha,alpha-phosphotrehalase [Tissierellia bacterium]|nr:alpha,alpha-phosphotrehalase [Tissierellia bacterium]
MLKDFKKSTIYQIYPKSFQDTNNDGIGDLQGVIKRLPYLHKLGVDFIWLSPIYPSHQYDNGYDVDDYCAIDPIFGDFDDFKELVSKANNLGINIMLDMVFNHTSTYHDWFQKALAGDKKYQDYYIFKDAKGESLPTNWESKFGGPAWKYVDELGKYYLHLYHEKQADLNWKNPQLRQELVEVLKFWKDKGVRGFRFDVINVISKPDIFEDDFEGDGRRFYTDGPMVTPWLKDLFSQAGIEDFVTVGELSSTSIDNSINYTKPENASLSMAFNFHHMKVDYKDGQKWTLQAMDWYKFFDLLDTWQREVQKGNGWSAWFMNNHDQPRALSRFMENENFQYELATSLASLTHLMRGSPYVYQGEEIGMTNPGFKSIDDYVDYESINYYKILLDKGISKDQALKILSTKSRDNARVPMRWDASETGGFTNQNAWMAFHPDRSINYEDAIRNENSIFYFYKDLIALRKKHPAISHGVYEKVYFDDKIYIFDRINDGEKIRVFMNFSDQEVEISQFIPEHVKILSNNYKNFDSKSLHPYNSIVLSY